MRRAPPLILVVAKAAATLAVCDDVLWSAGYATIGCQTARAAQRRIDTDQPDVVLLEFDLEWSDAGQDLLWLLRQDRATAALPVLLCSADRARLQARHRQLQTWLCHSLAQPFTTEQLLTAVQAALALAPLRSRAVGG